MNFNLSKIPTRSEYPRKFGVIMIAGKGLSVTETENFLSFALPHTDMVKIALAQQW